MTALDLRRAARDLESLGHLAEADRLRWQAERLDGVLSRHSDPAESVLAAELREADALGDLQAVARLSGVLASLAT